MATLHPAIAAVRCAIGGDLIPADQAEQTEHGGEHSYCRFHARAQEFRWWVLVDAGLDDTDFVDSLLFEPCRAG